mmetsp:Transcript_27690/g.69635  ORF Transcript_27690/g.69635 Transcript_27690/m.69635 type:complete len:220 (-) Transcript_27690:2123-2782(-)
MRPSSWPAMKTLPASASTRGTGATPPLSSPETRTSSPRRESLSSRSLDPRAHPAHMPYSNPDTTSSSPPRRCTSSKRCRTSRRALRGCCVRAASRSSRQRRTTLAWAVEFATLSARRASVGLQWGRCGGIPTGRATYARSFAQQEPRVMTRARARARRDDCRRRDWGGFVEFQNCFGGVLMLGRVAVAIWRACRRDRGGPARTPFRRHAPQGSCSGRTR